MTAPKNTRVALLAALVGIGLAAAALSARHTLSPAPQAAPRQLAPLFELPGLEGGTVSNADLAGRGYVLFFGSPECKPCQNVFPVLRELKNTQVLIVSVGPEEATRRMQAEYGFTFPIAVDTLHLSRETFRLAGLPTVVRVDRQGYILGSVDSDMRVIRFLTEAENSLADAP
ncbi:MAG: TlpA disulfide reductase family protein [Candidatus Latescibacterota bacterium]